MLFFLVNEKLKVVGLTGSYSAAAAAQQPGEKLISRHDFDTIEAATYFANEATKFNGINYLPIDNGSHVSPRFDIIELPKVGDPVSYGFNGDYYPCGYIASISKTFKKITTTTGETFYRRRQTGCWLRHGTWALVSGHRNERNPSF